MGLLEVLGLNTKGTYEKILERNRKKSEVRNPIPYFSLKGGLTREDEHNIRELKKEYGFDQYCDI